MQRLELSAPSPKPSLKRCLPDQMTQSRSPKDFADVAAGDLIYQRLSAVAYASPGMARHRAREVDSCAFVAHVSDKKTGADAMVFTTPGEVVVAVRGTQKDYRDILTNLRFRREDIEGSGPTVGVHRGFRDQWLSIEDGIKSALEIEDIKDLPVVFTGHSLGGAIAGIGAFRLSHLPRVRGVVTFGAPRIGDKLFAEAMSGRVKVDRRYVLGADVVPIVPLLTMGFRHHVRPIYLTHKGIMIKDCPLWRELLGRAAALFSLDWSKGWTWCPVPTRLYTDHRIGGYGAAMSKARASS